MTPVQPSEHADRWLFTTLAAVTTVTAVVSSLGAPLIPTIADAYDVRMSSAQWVLTSTMISAAAATPVFGRWGSGHLRRPVVLGCLVVVLLGLVLAALPLGFGSLIAGRALQGLGLAVAPLTLAIARDVWGGARLTSRLSLLSVATVAGAGLGYPVTALLAGYAGVAGAYWFGVALVGLTAVLAWRHLPRDAQGQPQRVDVAGALLVALGTSCLLLGVSRGENWGWLAPATVGLGVAGLSLVAAWLGRTVRLARSDRHPLVDLRLAVQPGVLGPNAVSFALAWAMYGLLTVVVLLVRGDGSAGWGLDHPTAVAGLVLVPYALASVAGSRVAIRVARRFGAHVLLPIGCTVFAASMTSLAAWHHSLWQALAAMALGGLGSGFTFSSLPMLIVPNVPPAETGSAMAFNQLLRYFGFAVGSATSVTLLEVLGGDRWAFRATLLVTASVCLAAGLALLYRAGPRRTVATSIIINTME